MGANCRVQGLPYLLGAPGGSIVLGDRVTLVSTEASAPLSLSHRSALRLMAPGAVIEIGDDSGITGGVIAARSGIRIGSRVLIGSSCLITDSDWHPVDTIPRRYADAPRPLESDRISIEDDVFIGARSIVLKGVTIGRGSIVGAGSVVAKSVPANVIVAGNPARVVRSLISDEAG